MGSSKHKPTGNPPGRPKPTVLIARHDNGWDGLAVLDAPLVYAIAYQGKVINIRQDFVSAAGNATQKYVRSTWTCRAHATRMCRKLSKFFNSTDFKVVALTLAELPSD